MLSLLKDYTGELIINDVKYSSIEEALKCTQNQLSDSISIKLNMKSQKQRMSESVSESNTEQYKIKVRQYMTKKATRDFNFMKQWNNDIPMPMRIMIGEKVKETKGMVYMKLHADIVAERVTTCMKCGRPLTNPVSQYFGIGPECGGHNYVNPFNSDEELKKAVDSYRKELQKITWEGWIIKSAIEEEVKL